MSFSDLQTLWDLALAFLCYHPLGLCTCCDFHLGGPILGSLTGCRSLLHCHLLQEAFLDLPVRELHPLSLSILFPCLIFLHINCYLPNIFAYCLSSSPLECKALKAELLSVLLSNALVHRKYSMKYSIFQAEWLISENNSDQGPCHLHRPWLKES